MTDVQLQYCKKCFNRKLEETNQENICNIRGKEMVFEGVCTSFELDEKVVISTEPNYKNIRPNVERARIAQMLIWIVMVVNIAAAYSSYLQYKLLIAFQNEEEITESMITFNDTREQAISIVYLIAFIVSGVTFIQWFRRAYFNLGKLTTTENSEGWAAGSWFVPIISIYRPYQIMKEMNDKTLGFLKSKTTDIIKDESQHIKLWWGLWVVSNYVGNYVMKTAFKEDSIENLLNSTIANMILSLIGIPLAIVTVEVIKSYALKEDKIAELISKAQ